MIFSVAYIINDFCGDVSRPFPHLATSCEFFSICCAFYFMQIKNMAVENYPNGQHGFYTLVEIALRCSGIRRFATTVLKLFTSGPAAGSRRNRPFGDFPFPLPLRCLSAGYS
jgi:hypothetical protein